MVSQANNHIEIEFQLRNGDSSCIPGGVNAQVAIVDDVSDGKAIKLPILLCVSFYLKSVTNLWDMIIRLCMCTGRMGHANVLDCKLHWLTSKECDIVRLVTVELEISYNIRAKTH